MYNATLGAQIMNQLAKICGEVVNLLFSSSMVIHLHSLASFGSNLISPLNLPKSTWSSSYSYSLLKHDDPKKLTIPTLNVLNYYKNENVVAIGKFTEHHFHKTL